MVFGFCGVDPGRDRPFLFSHLKKPSKEARHDVLGGGGMESIGDWGLGIGESAERGWGLGSGEKRARSEVGDWGVGIGEWGLGSADWGAGIGERGLGSGESAKRARREQR